MAGGGFRIYGFLRLWLFSRDQLHWESQVSCLYYPHFTRWLRLNCPLRSLESSLLNVGNCAATFIPISHSPWSVRSDAQSLTQAHIRASLLTWFQSQSLTQLSVLQSILGLLSGYQETHNWKETMNHWNVIFFSSSRDRVILPPISYTKSLVMSPNYQRKQMSLCNIPWPTVVNRISLPEDCQRIQQKGHSPCAC